MSTQSYTPATAELVLSIDTERIEASPFQPRIYFDPAKLQTLADSIEANGLHKPITVRPINDERGNIAGYQLVDGERRWRAVQLLGRTQINAIVREMSDEEVQRVVLVIDENSEPFTDYEKSQHFIRIATNTGELGESLSQREIARRMRCSMTMVRNNLMLATTNEDVLAVAMKRSQVTSSLLLIDTLPVHERAPLLAQVDRDNPVGFRTIEKQVEDVKERMKRDTESRRAPDAETSTRSRAFEESGGGQMSRGLQLKGTTSIQARREIDARTSEIESKVHTIEQWAKAHPTALGGVRAKLLELAKKMERLAQ